MGTLCSKEKSLQIADPDFGSTEVKSFRKPRWRSDNSISLLELQKMRDEFWDTEPHYGGNKVIWDAIKAAAEADVDTCRIILDSAGVKVASEDMTIMYDERGYRYQIPNFALSDPTNISREGSITKRLSFRGSQ